MPFSGLQIVTADQLNRLIPLEDEAACSLTLDVTTSAQDVPGATVDITTTMPGASYTATAVFYFNQTATTNNDPQGLFDLDGVTSSRIATFGGQVAGDEATVTQIWTGTLPSPDTYTFKLRASAPANSQWQVVATHTVIHVLVREVV